VIAFSRAALGSAIAEDVSAKSTTYPWRGVIPSAIITTIKMMIAAPRIGKKSIVAETRVLRFRARAFANWLTSNLDTSAILEVVSLQLDTTSAWQFLVTFRYQLQYL